jgi:plasmid stability protein
MRNITVSVPDDVYRRARIRAAERGTSVSAIVAEHLRSLSDEDTEFARLEALQDRVIADLGAFRGGDRLAREQVHDRALR